MNENYLKSIMLNDGTRKPIEFIGHKNMNYEEIGESLFAQEGEHLLNININYNHEYKETIELLKELNIKNNDNIVLDVKLLNNKEIINILKEKCTNKDITIRLVGEKYIINEEDAQKLAFASIIITNNTNKIISNTSFIFSKETENISYDCNLSEKKQIYYIKDLINYEDIKNIITEVNDEEITTEIFFKFYDLKKTFDILKNLKKYGISEKVKINILSNPLYDNIDDLNNIKKVLPNKINVTYNTCQDMIEKYNKEPYSKDNFYYSELEGGGITTLDNYIGIIEILTEQEKHMIEMQYSPLECIVYAYNYLKENYTYEEKDTDNPIETRSLEYVIKKDKMVCVGFSTLLSALMRRCNIPMFRYSSYRHSKNIARIKDDKYNLDIITTFDVTNDIALTEEEKETYQYSYQYFGISPYETTRTKNPDILTIASSLIIDMYTYAEIYENTRSQFAQNMVLDYQPLGFAVRMLELMGYKFKDYSINGIYELLENLNDNDCFEELYPEILKKALYTVLYKENKIKNKEIISTIENSFNNLIIERVINHKYNPAIKTSDNSNSLIEIQTTRKISKRALELYKILQLSNDEEDNNKVIEELSHYVVSSGFSLAEIEEAYNKSENNSYIK